MSSRSVVAMVSDVVKVVVAIVSDPEDAKEVVKIKQMNGIRPTHVRRVMIFFSVNFFFF